VEKDRGEISMQKPAIKEVDSQSKIDLKKELAIQLRTWIGKQPIKRTYPQWAEYVGLKPDTFKNYILRKEISTESKYRKVKANNKTSSIGIYKHY
jgi:hypothetical protein